MAKQDDQKQKSGRTARRGRSGAGAPKTRTVTSTRPLPPLETEEEIDDGTIPTVRLPRLPLVAEPVRRRQFLIGGAGLAATALTLGGWLWLATPHPSAPPQRPAPVRRGDKLVVYWNNATFILLRQQQAPLPVVARALSIVNTCMFDAWAAYDAVAQSTRPGTNVRQSESERTLPNKAQAMSYAAYRALLDLFPAEQERIHHIMSQLRYNPANRTNSPDTPAGVGNRAAQAVLSFRQNDGSNQAGRDLPGAYADYTHYQPLNTADDIKHADHWQPLTLPAGRPGTRSQQFACAQWANVTPFALTSALQFIPQPGPPHAPDQAFTSQARQILQYSAGLTDEQKVIAEYWSETPTEIILTRWFDFAVFLSQRAAHTLDENIKFFFSLANACLDTSIACWACKRAYDSAYPITVIRDLFKGQQVHAWAGPGRHVRWFNGQYWQPYQPLDALSPAYPEYCSEQSAFSAAAALIMRSFTGSDALGTNITRPPYSSAIEYIVPARPVTLSWPTLSQAVEQAGMAGRYGGIHFAQSDLDGRTLGTLVARQAWLKAQSYIHGHPTSN